MVKEESLQKMYALVYAKKGWPVFPCGTDKKPLTKNGFKDATTDAEQVAAWWTKHPAASIGCPTGPDSGILCLDVDLPDGPKSLAYLEAKYGSLPATMEQNTGSGGRHLLFKWPAGRTIKNSAGKLAAGLDVRGIGGYIILPPSGHPSGGKYAWNQDHFKRSDAPDWLLELVSPSSPPPHDEKEQPHLAQGLPYSTTAYGQKALDEEVAKMTSAVEGTRNDTLYKCGFALGQLVAGGELIREEAENGLLGAALASGLPDAEARKTLSNGLNDGEKIPRNSSKKNESSFQDAGQACPQFFHRQDGVYIREEIENKPVESWVCSPLKILAHTRDAAKQKWGLLVELSDLEGNLHQLVLLKRNMVGSGDTYRNQLVDMGLLMPIGSTAKQRLDLYLNNSKVDRFALYVDRIGWQGGMFILPDTVIGIHGDDEVIGVAPAKPDTLRLMTSG